jgi:hypothetical protein
MSLCKYICYAKGSCDNGNQTIVWGNRYHSEVQVQVHYLSLLCLIFFELCTFLPPSYPFYLTNLFNLGEISELFKIWHFLMKTNDLSTKSRKNHFKLSFLFLRNSCNPHQISLLSFAPFYLNYNWSQMNSIIDGCEIFSFIKIGEFLEILLEIGNLQSSLTSFVKYD